MPDKRTMGRRSFLAVGAAGAAFGVPEGSTTGARPHRNVLILVGDDHGRDQLGCYGNPKIKTPNLDTLAAAGVRFTHAFAVAASCSPSRGVMLTGLYTHQNGQYGLQHGSHHFALFDWVETLPALLKRNGYRTGAIGKVHVGPESLLPFDFLVPAGAPIRGARDGRTMAERAGEFFSQEPERPFFLWVGYSDPHRAGATGFANEPPYRGIPAAVYAPADVIVPPYLSDIPAARADLAEMYQSVSRLDAGVGMILERLRASGRYDDTLIIYLSDNGIPFPGAKTTVYDSGVRLPLIVCCPQVQGRGAVNEAMVSYVDLVPSTLDWTRTSGPKYELPGRSFLPILDQPNPVGWDVVYHSHTFHEVTMYYPMRAVRTDRYKYIRNLCPELEYPFASDLAGSPTWQSALKERPKFMGKRRVRDFLHRPAEELYDLGEDPDETVNLAQRPEYRGVLEGMRDRLARMRERTKDPWLILENYRAHAGPWPE